MRSTRKPGQLSLTLVPGGARPTSPSARRRTTEGRNARIAAQMDRQARAAAAAAAEARERGDLTAARIAEDRAAGAARAAAILRAGPQGVRDLLAS
jgi:hypothetical protein